MIDAAGNIEADDIAPRVDTEGPGRRGAWEIDAGEGTLAKQKSMVYAAAVRVPAGNFALRIDTEA
jgi:hypothetical protein